MSPTTADPPEVRRIRQLRQPGNPVVGNPAPHLAQKENSGHEGNEEITVAFRPNVGITFRITIP